MNLAMQTIPTRYPITFMSAISFYDLEDDDLFDELVKSDTWGHADELETAELLTLRPDRVKQDALTAGRRALRGAANASAFLAQRHSHEHRLPGLHR